MQIMKKNNHANEVVFPMRVFRLSSRNATMLDIIFRDFYHATYTRKIKRYHLHINVWIRNKILPSTSDRKAPHGYDDVWQKQVAPYPQNATPPNSIC